jgi:peptide/nickel transport system substrate-binding protein
MLLLPSDQAMADRFPGAWDNYGNITRFMIYSRLLRLNANLEPVYGDLAQSWTVAPDGLTYTFTLKNNVRWHDGTPFTAEDVAFSLKLAMKSPQVNSVIKSAINCIRGATAFAADTTRTASDNVEGIRINGNVITITMAQPSGTFLLAMAQFNILPRHKTLDANPLQMNSASFFDWPIGTGPYRVIEFIPNDYALLEVFPDYHGPRPTIPQAKLTFMSESDKATRALANDVDYFQTNSLDVAQAALRNPNYEAFYTDIYFIRYLRWNSKGPLHSGNDPLRDIRVRRAIVHAIDRQSIINALMPGQATMINTNVPSSFPYANNDVYNLDYNPAKARQLLQEANFDFNTVIRMACHHSDQTTRSEWRLLTGDLVPQLFENPDFHIVYAGLSAMAPEEAYNAFHSNTVSTTAWSNIFPLNYTGMDRLLEELWVTVDPVRRTQILRQLQVVETEEMLWHIPMFATRNIQVFNTTRVNLPPELVLSNEWSNYERYIEKWTLNPGR